MSERAGPLVLLAEDDADIRQLVRLRLESAGLRVVEASTGAEAVALADEHRTDLLLLDIGLPDTSGYDVCRRVLATSETPPAIIFLTARDATIDRVVGLEAGAVDYVAKPFDAAELVARVHAALRTKLRADDLVRRASTDALTGTLNRATLVQRASEHVALARRGRPLACALADIDCFKELNETHGHAAGDDALREIARRIRGSLRASDLVFRYGGDEFLVLLPDTPLAGAEVVAGNLLDRVCREPVLWRRAAEDVSLSIGVAAWQEDMDGAEDLVAAADAALYRAKQLGRACVSVSF